MNRNVKKYRNRFFNLLESEMGNVKPLIVESEEDWIEDSEEMDVESDFDEMGKEKEAVKDVVNAVEELDIDEKEDLEDFVRSVSPEELKDIIEDELESAEEMGEISEEEKEDIGMSDEEYKFRKTLHKIIQYAALGSIALALPVGAIVSAGLGVSLGIGSLVLTTLKDAAFFKSGGYDKFKTGHNYKAQNKMDREDLDEENW
jgi:hypothetical protein